MSWLRFRRYMGVSSLGLCAQLNSLRIYCLRLFTQVNYVCPVAVLFLIRSRCVVPECSSIADGTAVVGPGRASHTTSFEHSCNLSDGSSMWSYEGRNKTVFLTRSHFATGSEDAALQLRRMEECAVLLILP
ncbi:hypothetical protein EXIGLDRAFT_172712 [Exidia glandulosa HHB12029]|uniref:Uncharacterized protein n=1 Tax=Exidia glandulosa HHB12029 TaxID=1314781 RepID=A0A165F9D9_EXIGL|nr:hypothetical protein EXIGLDRAFT_172712 [Exidia glandulosa HHB12029]